MRPRVAAILLALVSLAAPAMAQPVTTAANAAFGVVSTGYNASDTSIVLSSGHGARFGSTFPMRAVWYNITDYPGGVNSSGTVDPNIEWIEITARSTDTLTVTRAVEGPAASTKNTAGKTYWIVAVPVTAASWNAVLASLGASPQALQTTSSPAFGGLTVDTNTFCVDGSANRAGIGTCAPAASLQMLGAAGAAFTIFHETNANATQSIYRYRRSRESSGALRRVQSGDPLGNIQFWGAEAADDVSLASYTGSAFTIRADARESFTSSAHGSQLLFFPTALGGSTTGSAALTVAQEATTLGPSNVLTWDAGAALSSVSNSATFKPASSRGWFTFQVENNPTEPGGGSDLHETDLYIYGKADAVSHYYTGSVTVGATNGTNVGSGTSILSEGNCTTCDGSDFTLRRFAIYEHSIGTELLMYQSSTPGYVQIGRNASGLGLGLLLYGQDVNAQATGEVAGLHTQGDFISNDTNTRTYYGQKALFTLNTGGSNANKTLHFDDLDTTNTATTGVGSASTLWRRGYGGSVKGALDIAGNLTIAGNFSGANGALSGTFTLSGDDQPAQITANTNDYSISSTAAVTVVDADQIRVLTGMTGGADGRQHTIINDGAADSVLILRQEDTGSSAANRFAMAADVVLEPGRAATFWYDSTASRWRLISSTAPAGAMRDYLPFDYTELLGSATADTKEVTEPWNYVAIGTGAAQSKVAGDGVHRGIHRITSGTAANSGGTLATDLTAYRLAGGEYAEFIVNVDTTTNTTIRLGFIDTATSTDVTDGAYIEIQASTSPTCKTANNSTRTTSSTIATISTATWYRMRIEVDNTAANVTCSIFDANGNSLGTQTNSANIPTGAGRETGHGIIATNSGTSATNAIQIDYMAVGTKRAVVR